MSLNDTNTRFARLKWRRAFNNWERKAARWVEAIKSGFDPNQPRVPAGSSDGGQWTGGGGGNGGGRTDTPDNKPRDFRNPNKPRVQLAQARRTRRSIQIGNRRLPASTGQAMRYGAAERRAKRLMERVRELDPSWKPRPSPAPPQTAEGAINTRRGEAREAEARLRELASQGLGPGPFAKESISARSPSRSFRVDERQELNRMGIRDGCHTCGSREPGTPSGNFVPDHQDPTALNQPGRPQRLYPQCLTCSSRQGGFVGSRKKKR